MTWRFVHLFCFFETYLLYFTATVAQTLASCRLMITARMRACTYVNTVAGYASEQS